MHLTLKAKVILLALVPVTSSRWCSAPRRRGCCRIWLLMKWPRPVSVCCRRNAASSSTTSRSHWARLRGSTMAPRKATWPGANRPSPSSRRSSTAPTATSSATTPTWCACSVATARWMSARAWPSGTTRTVCTSTVSWSTNRFVEKVHGLVRQIVEMTGQLTELVGQVSEQAQRSEQAMGQ